MALETLKPGKTFDSWDEVLSFLQELETVNFYLLRFIDKKTMASYNKAVSFENEYFLDESIYLSMFIVQLKNNFLDEKLQFKHATAICKHFGPPISRPKDYSRKWSMK